MDPMKLTYAACAVLVAMLVAWKFFPMPGKVSPLRPSASIDTFGPPVAPGQEPWAASERHQRSVRDKARKEAIAAVSGAWSNFCRTEQNKDVMAGLNYYFEQRGVHERGYPASWGEPGRRFIAQAYSTADDARIERMLRQLYQAGYFKLEDVRPSQRLMASKLLGDEKAGKNACPPSQTDASASR